MMQVARIIALGAAAVCLGVYAGERLQSPNRDRIPATLHAATSEIVAGRDCVLAEVFVETGATVTPDTPLLRFLDPRLEGAIAAKERELSEATAELQQREASAAVELSWRRRELLRETYETQQEIARLEHEHLSRKVEQIAWKEHLSETEVWTGGDASEIRLQPITMSRLRPDATRLQALLKEDAAAAAAEALQKQLSRAQQRLEELARLADGLESVVRVSSGVEVAAARKSRCEAELTALQEQQAALTIRSSSYGTVGLWHRQPGSPVRTGDVVVELLDEAQLSLIAHVPSQQIGRLAEGQKIEVEFADRLVRYGTVAAIPPQVARPVDAPQDPSLPVKIQPTGRLWPKLPIGSRVYLKLPRA